MGRVLDIIVRVSRLDRRWVFGVIALAVILPFVAPLAISATPSEQTRRFDEGLEQAIAAEGPILIGVDFGPQTMAEMEPVLMAILHRVFSAEKPAVFLTFLPEAASPMREYLARMEERYDLEYGKDYVFLGYATAYAYTIYGMGTSIADYFHTDDRGTPLADLPLTANLTNYDDVAAVIDIASNVMPRFWVQMGVGPYEFDFLMACTAVQATDYYPYLQSGQVKGLLAGGRAGAEYEVLLKDAGVIEDTGVATRGLGSQSLALIVMLAFIVLGNAGHLASKLRDRGGRR
jgi:hypothetical protein